MCFEKAFFEDGIEKVCLKPCNISTKGDKESEDIRLKQMETKVSNINNFSSNKILKHHSPKNPKDINYKEFSQDFNLSF